MSEPAATRQPVVLVSGLSGAGKASILRALEDIGFEAVDNPPLEFVEELVSGADGTGQRRIAIGVDTDQWLVIHLMIAGRLHWRPPQVKLAVGAPHDEAGQIGTAVETSDVVGPIGELAGRFGRSPLFL